MGDPKRLWGCLGRFLESLKVFRHHSEAGLWRRVGLYRPPSDGLQIQVPPLGQAGVWCRLRRLRLALLWGAFGTPWAAEAIWVPGCGYGRNWIRSLIF